MVKRGMVNQRHRHVPSSPSSDHLITELAMFKCLNPYVRETQQPDSAPKTAYASATMLLVACLHTMLATYHDARGQREIVVDAAEVLFAVGAFRRQYAAAFVL
jgi:hypothetical protein